MSTSTSTTTSASADGTVTTETVTVAEPQPAPMAAPADAAPFSKGHLIYFDGIGGRGEPIQLLLKLAKHDFEYETFTLEEFGNADSAYHKRKAAGEFGTFAACGGGLPIYKENGKKFFETNAILRMLGAKHGFYSTDPETMWEIDMCCEKVEQVFDHAQ